MFDRANTTHLIDINFIKMNYSIENILILILVSLLLSILALFAMKRLSEDVSRLGVFHTGTGVRLNHRIVSLYYTYSSILTVMWLFILITVFSFVSPDNLMDILLCTLIASAVISLSTRIIVTT